MANRIDQNLVLDGGSFLALGLGTFPVGAGRIQWVVDPQGPTVGNPAAGTVRAEVISGFGDPNTAGPAGGPVLLTLPADAGVYIRQNPVAGPAVTTLLYGTANGGVSWIPLTFP